MLSDIGDVLDEKGLYWQRTEKQHQELKSGI